MFICTYALHTAFYACFQFQIPRYTRFTVIPLNSLMSFVIICTAYLDHITWSLTCNCYARHLTFLYVLASCIWQPWILMSRSWSLDHGGLAVPDQSAQQTLPWWSERSRSLDAAAALPPSSYPVWLPRPSCCIVSTSLLCISLHVLYSFIFSVM